MPAARSEVFNEPSDEETAVWRYMDFAKVVHLLETHALFFARADRLGDPFEGTFPIGNRLAQIASARHITSPQHAKLLEQVEIEPKETLLWRRSRTFISCWHLNQSESAGMWRLYAKSNDAVAVRSTYGRLRQVLESDTFVGLVKYIDFERDLMQKSSLLAPFVHKRNPYSHEREVRALFTRWDYPNDVKNSTQILPEFGLCRRVDLRALVDAIYMAPTSAAWMRELVVRLVKRAKLKVPVIRSSLDDTPQF